MATLTLTTHYIDGAFVESHGRQVTEIPWTCRWDKTTVTLEPVGVAGLITAWNANALFMCLKLASAAAAGCTVVIKPSELSSLQSRVLVEAPPALVANTADTESKHSLRREPSSSHDTRRYLAH